MSIPSAILSLALLGTSEWHIAKGLVILTTCRTCQPGVAIWALWRVRTVEGLRLGVGGGRFGTPFGAGWGGLGELNLLLGSQIRGSRILGS